MSDPARPTHHLRTTALWAALIAAVAAIASAPTVLRPRATIEGASVDHDGDVAIIQTTLSAGGLRGWRLAGASVVGRAVRLARADEVPATLLARRARVPLVTADVRRVPSMPLDGGSVAVAVIVERCADLRDALPELPDDPRGAGLELRLVVPGAFGPVTARVPGPMLEGWALGACSRS